MQLLGTSRQNLKKNRAWRCLEVLQGLQFSFKTGPPVTPVKENVEGRTSPVLVPSKDDGLSSRSFHDESHQKHKATGMEPLATPLWPATKKDPRQTTHQFREKYTP